jgi:uncharacterized protein involved in tolerance to divalent cations
MKMRTTAVEWLEKICNDRGYHLMSEYFEQAKEMEKKQLNEAMNYDRPFLCCWEDNSAFEEYYKETFKK